MIWILWHLRCIFLCFFFHFITLYFAMHAQELQYLYFSQEICCQGLNIRSFNDILVLLTMIYCASVEAANSDTSVLFGSHDLLLVMHVHCIMWPFCSDNFANILENSFAYFSLCNLYGIVIKINSIICQNTVLKAVQLSDNLMFEISNLRLHIHCRTF